MADIETILNENREHVPYAIGVMKVSPGQELPSKGSITWWFSEDLFLGSSFEDRSIMILNGFLDYIKLLFQSDRMLKVIYFHNLSRFDGILIIKHIIANRPDWVVNPLMRNGSIYQFIIKVNQVKILFRDTMKLLPSSLHTLGGSLCPELGDKGDVDHSTVSVDNLKERKVELLAYMKQDIHLLGGIMLKTQAIYLDLSIRD